MKSISGKKFARLLERHGWILLRIQGSHHIYGKKGNIARISVPVHGSKLLRVGLLKHFLKIAGLSEDDL